VKIGINALAIVIIANSIFAVKGLAGTGQIFSPAGLPQSSTQSYTPPTPGNTPTVTFPTPPLPVGGLSGFPASSLPLNAGNQKPSGSTFVEGKVQLNAPLAPPISTVDTFFQCPPAAPSEGQRQSKARGPGRFVWHVLDNLGVPMFYSKDADLDPTINRAFAMPLPPVLEKTNGPVTPQKIPASELEGTEPSPNDAK
jgi:hypothetical protein